MPSPLIVYTPPADGSPCGVADYARHIPEALGGSVSLVPLHLPLERCPRNRLFKIWRLRRAARLAALNLPPGIPVHVQYSDFAWNGTRLYEDAYEVFTRFVRRPFMATVHEHPWLRSLPESAGIQTLADRVFARLAGLGGRHGGVSFETLVLNRHALLHVHHRWQYHRLVEAGVNPSILRVWPHPVPSVASVKGSGGQAFRQRFSGNASRLIGIVGFIFDRKQYERAIAMLPNLPPDTILCAIGGTQGRESERYLEQLRDQARRAGVADRFVVTGWLPEPDFHEILSEMDLVLAPYGEVSSSGSLAWAVAVGAPIVAQDAPSFREIYEDGGGLELVDTTSPSVFTEAVRRVLEDSGCSRSLRERNRNYASRYSWTAFINVLRAWYAELCPAASPDSPQR